MGNQHNNGEATLGTTARNSLELAQQGQKARNTAVDVKLSSWGLSPSRHFNYPGATANQHQVMAGIGSGTDTEASTDLSSCEFGLCIGIKTETVADMEMKMDKQMEAEVDADAKVGAKEEDAEEEDVVVVGMRASGSAFRLLLSDPTRAPTPPPTPVAIYVPTTASTVRPQSAAQSVCNAAPPPQTPPLPLPPRYVFISLLSLSQTWLSAPPHVLLDSIVVLPLKRTWLYHRDLSKYRNPFHHLLADPQFVTFLRLKDKQKLALFMEDDYSRYFPDRTKTIPESNQHKNKSKTKETKKSQKKKKFRPHAFWLYFSSQLTSIPVDRRYNSRSSIYNNNNNNCAAAVAVSAAVALVDGGDDGYGYAHGYKYEGDGVCYRPLSLKKTYWLRRFAAAIAMKRENDPDYSRLLERANVANCLEYQVLGELHLNKRRKFKVLKAIIQESNPNLIVVRAYRCTNTTTTAESVATNAEAADADTVEVGVEVDMEYQAQQQRPHFSNHVLSSSLSSEKNYWVSGDYFQDEVIVNCD